MLTPDEQTEATELLKKREYELGFKDGWKAKEEEIKKQQEEAVKLEAELEDKEGQLKDEDGKVLNEDEVDYGEKQPEVFNE